MPQKEYFKLHVALYLVLKKDRQVLLIRRRNTGYMDGFYSLIGGHLDEHETATNGLIREAKEEVGITIDPSDLTMRHTTHRHNPEREYIDLYFTCNKWVGTPTIKESEKHDDLRWFNLDALPNNIVPEVKLALESIDRGIVYSEFGWE